MTSMLASLGRSLYRRPVVALQCRYSRLYHQTNALYHESPLSSHLTSNDILQLVARLSPLAVQAHCLHSQITSTSSSLSLSAKQSSQLQHLTPIAESVSRLSSLGSELFDISTLLSDPSSDKELLILAKDEQQTLYERLFEESSQLLHSLLHYDQHRQQQIENEKNKKNETSHDNQQAPPPSPSSALIEIRAGTGGDEASLFASELLQMYTNLSDTLNWKTKIISKSETDLKGIRQAIMKVNGHECFKMLETESGVHRVQRVPKTETQGRIHTSTVSTVILPDYNKNMQQMIKPSDVKIDVYRASGAGGQHVNTTESAVRATHLPTGIVATCQDERSQHRNKAVALESLNQKVLAKHIKDLADKRLSDKREQLGSGNTSGGERSDRIRTYNFPQRRVTDHRIVLNSHIVKLLKQTRSHDALQIDKNFDLPSVIIGGKELIRLIDSVKIISIFNQISNMIEDADNLKSKDSEQLSEILLNKSMLQNCS